MRVLRLWAIVGAVLLLSVSLASAEPPGRFQVPDETIDQELFDALDASGLLDEWQDASLTREELTFLPVIGTNYDRQRQELLDLLRAEQQVAGAWAANAANATLTEQELRLLAEDRDDALAFVEESDAAIGRLEGELRWIDDEIARVDTTLTEIAVTWYMGGRLAQELQTVRAQDAIDRELNRTTVLAAADASYDDYRLMLVEERTARLTDLGVHAANRAATIAVLAEIDAQEAEAETRVSQLEGDITSLRVGGGDILADAAAMIPALHQARVTAVVPDLGFSLVAYDAYLAAAETMADAPAECQIDWTVIAGIGFIESKHGTLGNRFIAANGNLSRPLLGILLDGGGDDDGDGDASGFRTIPDTDGGQLDGSAEYDRALGPMQFLPSTWRAHGVDGNGDGVRDPQNIYDAAAGSANYLCDVAGQIGSGEISRRLRGYNDSSAYVTDVLDTAASLAALRPAEPGD